MATVLDKIDGFVGRCGEILLVDPRVIKVVNGWNARIDFTDDDGLYESIKEHGVMEALRIKKNGTSLELVSGERRLRAVMQAISDGIDIKSVPVKVIAKNADDCELFITDFNDNIHHKPLSPIEEAGAFRRMIDLWGMSVQDISKKTGRSISHIRNRLELDNASPEVKAAVMAGDIPVAKAQEIVKIQGTDEQKDALDLAVKKTKVKRQVIRLVNDKPIMTGYKEDHCDPILDLLDDEKFKKAVKEAGFDPKTIKISIEPETK